MITAAVYQICKTDFETDIKILFFLKILFNALMLLVGQQEEHPALKICSLNPF